MEEYDVKPQSTHDILTSHRLLISEDQVPQWCQTLYYHFESKRQYIQGCQQQRARLVQTVGKYE